MVCAGIETIKDVGLTGFLQYPTTCDYLFYAKIMFAFWFVLVMTLYWVDWTRNRSPDVISCLGVASLGTIFVSLAGTLSGIIQQDIFLGVFVIGIIFVGMWLFKRS